MRPILFKSHGLALALLTAAALTGPAAAQPMDQPDFTITAAERTAVLEGAIAKLNASYVIPETARKMEAALRARMAKREYDSITSAKALAEKLTGDLREVSHDKHLFVHYDPAGVPDPAPGAPMSAAELSRQREWLAKVNFGFEKVERMGGNVGYLKIRGFVPPSLGGETASAAMTLVANTDALILDLRRNGGGEPAMIAYILSYLFDAPTHLNDIYDRPADKTEQWWTMPYVPGLRYGGTKPVYVLTSKDTFSGGEELAYDLKTLKRATLVGETTGGGAHPVRPFKVSEHFAIGVPFARAINPITGTNWEGTGVAPDVATPADQALDTAYRMVLEKMLETTSDPGMREQIQKVLAERKRG